jgi:hypothetical protein
MKAHLQPGQAEKPTCKQVKKRNKMQPGQAEKPNLQPGQAENHTGTALKIDRGTVAEREEDIYRYHR